MNEATCGLCDNEARGFWPRLVVAARRATFALALVLIGVGVLSPVQHDQTATHSGHDDLDLYARFIDQVRAGQPYEVVAVRDLREMGGALRPFVTVRPPAATLVMAALPAVEYRILAIRLLAALVVVAWALRLKASGSHPVALALSIFMLLTGVAVAFAPQAYLMHEAWAGLLISLSLAMRRPGNWAGAVLVGLAAAVIRELAAPYLVVMAAFAFRDRAYKEAIGWCCALLVFGLALAIHAFAVNSLLIPQDRTSPSWLAIGGWPFVLHAASWNVLALASRAWITVLYPVALIGLAYWRGPLGNRLVTTIFIYTASFFFVGRWTNSYWGLIIAPIWPLGLAAVTSFVGELTSARVLKGVPRPPPRHVKRQLSSEAGAAGEPAAETGDEALEPLGPHGVGRGPGGIG